MAAPPRLPPPWPGSHRLLPAVAWLVLATAALTWLLRPHLATAQAVGSALRAGVLPPFADLVVSACAGGLALCWAWLVAGATLVAWQTLRPGSPLAGLRLRWVPRFVRALVPALVVPLVALAPASADVSGLPLPDRPTTPESAVPGPATPPTSAPDANLESDATGVLPRTAPSRHVSGLPHGSRAPSPGTVVVRPGDSLWSIAASRLPERAGLAAVDRAWRRIARANAPRLPDPHLIAPGLRLRLPHLTEPKDTP